MKDLIEKYKRNELTPEELHALQTRIATESPLELERIVREDWENFQNQRLEMPDKEADFDRIWKEIERNTAQETVINWRKILSYAAILLLPILLFSTFYFYREAKIVATQEMIVQTGAGEHANITLPDGTFVSLNVRSKLSYNPADFNKRTRNIGFMGEGYFQVKKDEGIPFVISSQAIQLKVLGTEFNFRSRESQDDIEVILTKGHVLLSSSDKYVELFENETAIYNKQTGTFSIEKKKDEPIHWLHKELYFQNTPFAELVETLEEEYDVRFEWQACDHLAGDRFSGTLPSSNLRAVLDILRKSYGLEYEVNANRVILTCTKSN